MQSLLSGKCLIKRLKKRFLKSKHHQIRVDENQIGNESVSVRASRRKKFRIDRI